MLRKDYLVKQLEEFGKVLALILTYKKTKEWDQFEKEIHEALHRFTALNMVYIENLSPEQFQNEILSHPSLLLEQKKILGSLLFEKMDYYALNNEQTKYADLKKKCLALYEFLAQDQTANEYNLDVHYKLAFLKKMEP